MTYSGLDIGNRSFPKCIKSNDSGPNTIFPPSYYAVNLVKDSQNRDRTMPKFREEYENTNDAILFEHAPASLYIASPLG